VDLIKGATFRPVKERVDIAKEPNESLSLDSAFASDWILSRPELQESCEAGQRLRVAVLLSGGVDSSLALKLLHTAGHDVKAFYLKIWFQEDFRNFWDACPWEEDLYYAQKVCESLGVELEAVPLTEQYWDRVVRESVRAIRRGLTPNPDVLCNSRVKFGAFCEMLQAERPGEFDRVASGHYARLRRPRDKGGSGSGAAVELRTTPDAVKDQTYFLAQLSQEQLSRAMFPLGPLTKPEVRAMARAAGLATQGRKDSQGICFLGKVRFGEFVREHLGEWPGLIVEEETGRQLGFHRGFWFYTIGQRSGLLLPDGPWYVVRKDIDMNVVYASKHYYSDEKMRRRFSCGRVNWISGSRPDPEDGPIQCKVRHGPKTYNCELEHDRAGRVLVELDRDDQGLACGQYAAFYQAGKCLGCGMIQEHRQKGMDG